MMTFNLNRFSKDKQEQLEQFVAYAQLMGLSGRDLVAIGGKIEREQVKQRKLANMEIVRSFDCISIGADTKYELDKRFKLKTDIGAYNFEDQGWNRWEVASLKTKVKKTHHVDTYDYDLPKTDYRTRQRYAMLLDIYFGKFTLNF
jgi:hypothetical protein